MFSSLKDKLSHSAQKTVDGFENTVDNAVDKGTQNAQKKVDSAVNDAVPAQKSGNATAKPAANK